MPTLRRSAMRTCGTIFRHNRYRCRWRGHSRGTGAGVVGCRLAGRDAVSLGCVVLSVIARRDRGHRDHHVPEEDWEEWLQTVPGDRSERIKWGTPQGRDIREGGYGPTERLGPTSLSARLDRPIHNRK